MHCPICHHDFEPDDPGRSGRFCSDRCRLGDLGNWFAEAYAVPGPPAPEALGVEEDQP